MFVQCKKCGMKISAAGRPKGSTRTSNVRLEGNVRVEGGGISFGPGGSISFGPGGTIGFGPPTASEFTCVECGHTDRYATDEIKE